MKPTCADCRRDQENGKKEECPGIDWVEQCPLGQVPKLSEGNLEFWRVFSRVYPGLLNGFGGVDFGNIKAVFELFAVPEELRPLYFDKCLICIAAIRYNEELERKHAKSHAESQSKR